MCMCVILRGETQSEAVLAECTADGGREAGDGEERQSQGLESHIESFFFFVENS